MAGLGNEIPVVKAPQQRMVLHCQTVTVNAEKFSWQRMLLNAVVVIQHGLGAPAEGQNGENMILGPADIIHQLRPVLHLFKFQTFHRRPGNDEAVVITVFYVREFQIGLVQIGIIRVGRLPGHRPGKIHFHLQGVVAQQTQQLQLCRFFQGHQVQDQNLQGTDILCHRPFLRNGNDSFPQQIFYCRQLVCDFYRHNFFLLAAGEVMVKVFEDDSV